MTYVELIISFSDKFPSLNKQSLDQKMLQDLGCAGIQDFALDEAELSLLLGDKAVTGGPLPADILADIESYCLSQNSKQSTYFFEGLDAHNLALIAKDFVQAIYAEDANCQLQSCQEESWLEKWKEHYHPISIDSEFMVVPSWTETNDMTIPYVLKIDPGQAFGTGSHESTKLCLKLLKQYFGPTNNHSYKTVMDFGCGSGILGLGALLLNPKAKICLFDIDPDAYENVEKNIQINGLNHDHVELIPAGQTLPQPWATTNYDLVFANILLPILLLQSPLLTSLVKNNGYLLISGIMSEQWDELHKKLNELAHWKVCQKSDLNDWLAVLIQKQ